MGASGANRAALLETLSARFYQVRIDHRSDRSLIPSSLCTSSRADMFLACLVYCGSNFAEWEQYNLYDLLQHMLPGLVVYFTDPAQHTIRAGNDLGGVDDLSVGDVSVRRVNTNVVRPNITSSFSSACSLYQVPGSSLGGRAFALYTPVILLCQWFYFEQSPLLVDFSQVSVYCNQQPCATYARGGGIVARSNTASNDSLGT